PRGSSPPTPGVAPCSAAAGRPSPRSRRCSRSASSRPPAFPIRPGSSSSWDGRAPAADRSPGHSRSAALPSLARTGRSTADSRRSGPFPRPLRHDGRISARVLGDPAGRPVGVALPVYLALVLLAALAGFVVLGSAAERGFRDHPVMRRVALVLTSLGFCVA